MVKAVLRPGTIILPEIQPPRGIFGYKEIVTRIKGHDHRNYGVLLVKDSSRKGLRSAVYTIAKYFRREFGYDFIQYGIDNDDATVYLFYKEDHLNEAVGAVCFRFKSTVYPDKSTEYRWWLDWAWFHPYQRQKGLLSGLLPTIKKEHPRMLLSYPLSKGMDKFDKKYRLDERHREEKKGAKNDAI